MKNKKNVVSIIAGFLACTSIAVSASALPLGSAATYNIPKNEKSWFGRDYAWLLENDADVYLNYTVPSGANLNFILHKYEIWTDPVRVRYDDQTSGAYTKTVYGVLADDYYFEVERGSETSGTTSSYTGTVNFTVKKYI